MEIAGEAFSGCDNITSIVIQNSMTELEYNPYCYGPDPWNSIIDICRVFHDCYSLRELHIRHEHPEELEIDIDAFDALENCTLYVPVGTGYAYRHHPAFKGKFKEVIIEK